MLRGQQQSNSKRSVKKNPKNKPPNQTIHKQPKNGKVDNLVSHVQEPETLNYITR